MFSLYLKTITPNYALIGILAATSNLVTMFFAVPLGELEDHIDSNIFLKWGLFGYCILSLIYLLAGVYGMLSILIFGLIFNGVVSSMVVVSARTYIKKKSPNNKESTFAGLFNMFYFGFYALAMFLGYYGHKIYNLNTMFLTITITSFIAFL